MYINKHDYSKDCAIKGQATEHIFEKVLQQYKIKYRKATLNEQYQHIDYILNIKNENVSIDIKSSKKVNRQDTNDNNDIIWVEFKNVQGQTGWLYGKNDLLAFYKSDEQQFYIVKTSELASLCEKLCNNGVVNYSSNALYHHYTRFGRKDDLSMIYFDDLKKCNYLVFKLCS